MASQHVIPLNTGKVQIGKDYRPPVHVHHDRDALRLQRALLGERAPVDWSGLAIVLVVLLVAALAISAKGSP